MMPRRCQNNVSQVLLLLAGANIIPLEVARDYCKQVDKPVYQQLVDAPDLAIDINPKDVRPVDAAEVSTKYREFARKNKLKLLDYDTCLQ
jgi:hypothetical protein